MHLQINRKRKGGILEGRSYHIDSPRRFLFKAEDSRWVLQKKLDALQHEQSAIVRVVLLWYLVNNKIEGLSMLARKSMLPCTPKWIFVRR